MGVTVHPVHPVHLTTEKINAVVARLAENARESVQIMTDVGSRESIGVEETVKKGSSTSVEKAKYASEVTIVSRVRKSVQILKGVKGNQQKNVRPTAKRNGVIVDAQVVLLVDHVKESALKMMDVVSLRLDTASVTVKKGSVLQLHVKEAMIQLQKYASVVSLVVHVSENVRRMRVVAGNQQGNVKATAKRSGVHVKFLSYFFY